MIRLARPWIGDEEQARVAAVLESGMLVQGAVVAEFEEALAKRCGRRFAIACGSGTSALELALAALEVTSGEVLCPDLSWPSPAHAIVRAGARPRLVDVNGSSWNATADGLRAARNEHTQAAIVIDQFGMPADVPAIEAALGDLPIVVDAACSLGATLDESAAGAFGAIACLSFHPRKLITTGEGGACLTDDEETAETIRMLRNHGQRGPGVFGAAAGNHRMTEMAAAMGLAQLERLDAIVDRRRELAERYRSVLSYRTQGPPREGAASNYQTFGILLPSEETDRDALIASIRAKGVEVGRLSYALHRIDSLRAYAEPSERFVEAETICDRGLALPLHPLLTNDEQDRVIKTLEGTL